MIRCRSSYIRNETIDGGKAFDWGRASIDYAKYRDIYPQEFYNKILQRRLCTDGQKVLDIGTGTGVLPRNMYQYGAEWTGTDISEGQIEQAKILSEGMDIDYRACPAEDIDFPDHSFDVITAWLPFEDRIAGASEELVLKYSPRWSGAGERIHPIAVPECYSEKFDLVYHEEYPLKVHFTRESWNGRMKACRGIGASLTEKEIAEWEKEHRKMLLETAPAEFDILHYGALAELGKK